MAATGAPNRVPVAVACGVLKLSRQGYYQWLAEPVCQRDWDDAHLINAAFDAHAVDPGFGYRFIADELADQGFIASENRVWRLCSIQGIFSIHSKKRGLNRKAGPPVHDDLLTTVDHHGRPGREFTATRPNEKWLTGITEHHTAEGKLYLCAIKDCYSGRIVGYSIDSRMKASLAVSALRNAIALRGPAGTIVHSHRGSEGGFDRSSQHLVMEVQWFVDRRLQMEGSVRSWDRPVIRSSSVTSR
jgi:putative transposase